MVKMNYSHNFFCKLNIQKVVLLFFLLKACSFSKVDDGSILHIGEATYYGEGAFGHCGFPVERQPKYHGAMNHVDYDSAAACGTWVEINGPKGSVVAFIDDECPECKEGDIDLGPVTFEQIADKKDGRVPITWRYVPGQVTGPILYYCKEGSSKWHIELQIRNHRYAILSVDIKTFDSEWYNMKRTPYNFFILPGGVNSKEGPYIVRVKDIFGQELIDTLPVIKSEVEYSGLRNFPVYNTHTALQFSTKFTSNKSSFVKTMNSSTLISFCKYYKGQIEVFSISGKKIFSFYSPPQVQIKSYFKNISSESVFIVRFRP